MSEENHRVHAKIIGKVQGVGFRHFTRRIAEDTGVTGWVRNRRDRTVETLAEGTKPQLETFIHRVKQGPRAGYVENLVDDWSESSGEFKNFRIRITC